MSKWLKSVSEFLSVNNLKNYVKKKTFLKNPDDPSNLILANCPKSFQNSITLKIGIFNFQKLTTTVGF